MNANANGAQGRSTPDSSIAPSQHAGSTRYDRRLLKPAEFALTVLLFAGWLMVFAGGILIDTQPYRYRISPTGVAALENTPVAEAVPGLESRTPSPAPGLITSWIVVLLWFLPLNLALICVTAGGLGAVGQRANLHADDVRRSPGDTSHPYLSSLLRGFFVYLFFISGLLILDDAPFATSSPSQYVRLAGFLSFFSFAVNYNPALFSHISDLAHRRIQTKGGASEEYQRTDSTYRLSVAANHKDGEVIRTGFHEEIRTSVEENGASTPKGEPTVQPSAPAAKDP